MDIVVPLALTFPNPFKGQDLLEVQQFATLDRGRLKIDRPSLDQLQTFCQARGIQLHLSKEADQCYRDLITVRIYHRNPTYRLRFSNRARHVLIEQEAQWKIGAKPTNDPWEYEVSHTYLLEACFQILRKYGYSYPKEFDKAAITDEVVLTRFESFVEPTEHQQDSIKQSIERNGRCLVCDDAGMGKTITAGLILKHFFEKGRARRGLWIVPTVPVALQTVEELATKFNCEAFALYNNVPRKKRLGLDDMNSVYKEHGLIVTTWSTFTRDWTLDFTQVKAIPFDFVVFDENHLCNSTDNKAFKAARGQNGTYHRVEQAGSL